jgi:hypothetical protein
MFVGVEETDEKPELPTEVVAPFNLTAMHLRGCVSSGKILPILGIGNATLKIPFHSNLPRFRLRCCGQVAA